MASETGIMSDGVPFVSPAPPAMFFSSSFVNFKSFKIVFFHFIILLIKSVFWRNQPCEDNITLKKTFVNIIYKRIVTRINVFITRKNRADFVW